MIDSNCLVFAKGSYSFINDLLTNKITDDITKLSSLKILAKTPCTAYTLKSLRTQVSHGLVAFLIEESELLQNMTHIYALFEGNIVIIPCDVNSELFNRELGTTSSYYLTQRTIFTELQQTGGDLFAVPQGLPYRRLIEFLAEELLCRSYNVEALIQSMYVNKSKSKTLLESFATSLIGTFKKTKVVFACRRLTKTRIEAVLPAFDNLTILQGDVNDAYDSYIVFYGETLFDIKLLFNSVFLPTNLYTIGVLPDTRSVIATGELYKWVTCTGSNSNALTYSDGIDLMKGHITSPSIAHILKALNIESLGELNIPVE